MSVHLLDLNAVVLEASRLDALPQSLVRLAGLLAREDPDLQQVLTVVRLDEALTGRLLAAANAVLGDPRLAVTSVEEAVLRLGGEAVLSLALVAPLQGEADGARTAPELEEDALWRHSVTSALAIELARSHLARPIPAHAFATALLHDVGKLVLGRVLDAATTRSVRAARTRSVRAEEGAELEILGVTHGEVGALIVRTWGLPDPVAAGIRYHHRPLLAPTCEGRHLAYLTALADAVADHVGEGSGSGARRTVLDPDVAGALGVTGRSFDALCVEAEGELRTVLEQYAA